MVYSVATFYKFKPILPTHFNSSWKDSSTLNLPTESVSKRQFTCYMELLQKVQKDLEAKAHD